MERRKELTDDPEMHAFLDCKLSELNNQKLAQKQLSLFLDQGLDNLNIDQIYQAYVENNAEILQMQFPMPISSGEQVQSNDVLTGELVLAIRLL